MNLTIAILTGMLVIVSACYAWRTRHAVKIMWGQQTASLRPLLVFACREGNWHVVSVGSGPAVNGGHETSYQETGTHFAPIGGPGGTREASPSGPLEPLGAGDIHDHTVYFEPALHALLTYENLAGRRCWSRYCPQKQCWDSGEANVAQKDFGCDCKLDDKGRIVRQAQE